VCCLDRGSGVQINKSASTLLPHQRRSLRGRLGVDGNVCCSVLQIGILVFPSVFRSDEISFSVYCWRSWLSATAMGARGEVVLLERGYWSGGGSNLVDGRRQILVKNGTRTSSGRHATTTSDSMRVVGLFIDSQSLSGNDAFSDLAIVKA
jgi:hypothetical protein